MAPINYNNHSGSNNNNAANLLLIIILILLLTNSGALTWLTSLMNGFVNSLGGALTGGLGTGGFSFAAAVPEPCSTAE
jgi:hypothetical protein